MIEKKDKCGLLMKKRDKKDKRGLFFPMRARYAKPKINLPRPNLICARSTLIHGGSAISTLKSKCVYFLIEMRFLLSLNEGIYA